MIKWYDLPPPVPPASDDRWLRPRLISCLPIFDDVLVSTLFSLELDESVDVDALSFRLPDPFLLDCGCC